MINPLESRVSHEYVGLIEYMGVPQKLRAVLNAVTVYATLGLRLTDVVIALITLGIQVVDRQGSIIVRVIV